MANVREIQNPAFSAVLTRSLRNLGIQQVIKFDRVLLNDGNCYETHTGMFTAPVAGRYLFIYNFGLHGSTETWLQLVKNGARQNQAGVEGKVSDQNLQGGNAAIIYLNQGDDVWIETAILSDVTVEEYSTTFSGALLY
ncbi:complement C1q-like protein 4 [Mercenaria mercenaria]|uniref:complement C1q-like protein 4 n=1 Tax=Mercenaria mercenaria TaxID=6596 RepID=UPI00234E6EF0|nr:complement C1q-like protein 4 [Mercenaria mercenaria]